MTQAGIDLVKQFEGCKLAAYRDGAGILTIGYGHTHWVQEGDVCTQEQADAWLLSDLESMENSVLICLSPRISSQITDNQLSALVSFAYNVGLGYKGIKDGFKVLKSGEPSTLLKCLLALDFPGAAAEFPKWDKISGQESSGILRRRMAEQALFLSA